MAEYLSQAVNVLKIYYSTAFKLGAVEQVGRGELTYKQVQDKYAVQGYL